MEFEGEGENNLFHPFEDSLHPFYEAFLRLPKLQSQDGK